jgi:sugar phosphate isomerase/epimerase
MSNAGSRSHAKSGSGLRLGVSLNFVQHKSVTAEVAQAVARSAIATLEVPGAFLADPAQRELIVRYLTVPTGPRVVSVHSPFSEAIDISRTDPGGTEEGLEAARAAIRAAAGLGTDLLVIHPSAEPIGPEERAVRLERSRASLAALAGPARAARCRVAVELLPRTCLGNTVEEMAPLLAGLDERMFGVCLDVNHLMGRYAALPHVVRALGARLFTLHLSDYDGVDEKHWMPGRGVIDWPGFMAALREIDYAGPLNYEADPELPGLANRIAAFESNFGWLCGLA